MQNAREKVKKVVDRMNVSKEICDHLFGEDHSAHHRMVAGVVVMVVGVLVANIRVDVVIIKFVLDGVGYLIHGVGCIPIIDGLRKEKEK